MDLPHKPISTDVFYKKDTWYAITINPQDQHQYFQSDKRYLAFRNFWASLFLSLPQNRIDYRFNIELSEPQNLKFNSGGPRLHLHGRIRFNANRSIYDFLINILGKWNMYGIIDIDTIDDLEIWDTYCTKQEHIFKQISPRITNSDDLY